MKKGPLWLAASFIAVLVPGLATPAYPNALMLMMDRVNFIPGESSIFGFQPYEIGSGSSSWWIYGEDGKNYYHFTHRPETPYFSIAKDNPCPGFDKSDVSTWCRRVAGSPR